MKGKKQFLTENRKARHDYFFNDELEAGVVLKGWEVKSIKSGQVTMKEAYITFSNDECFIDGLSLTPVKGNAFITDEEKSRRKKLLLNRREISKLREKVQKDGITAIPYGLYLKYGLIKVMVIEAKGKKNHDKRQTVATRDWERSKARLLKSSL